MVPSVRGFCQVSICFFSRREVSVVGLQVVVVVVVRIPSFLTAAISTYIIVIVFVFVFKALGARCSWDPVSKLVKRRGTQAAIVAVSTKRAYCSWCSTTTTTATATTTIVAIKATIVVLTTFVSAEGAACCARQKRRMDVDESACLALPGPSYCFTF